LTIKADALDALGYDTAKLGKMPSTENIGAIKICFSAKETLESVFEVVGKEILPAIKDGDLVIIRSTVSIQTTRTIVEPLLHETGKQFYLAMCPERTVEGKALSELKGLPQIIGGLNPESAKAAGTFFQEICSEMIQMYRNCPIPPVLTSFNCVGNDNNNPSTRIQKMTNSVKYNIKTN
jgi:hypothetical protein